jgi:NAD(P)-dependent dehydrogenase (short-subunit alcohol dehydrogenase family)
MAQDFLKDKVVLITGSGRGIGREIALTLASRGASIVVNDIGAGLFGQDEKKESPGDEVVREIREAGGKAIANGDSVSDWKGAQNMVAQAVKEFGRLDAVVNNAGILRDGLFHKMMPEDFDAVVKVHLYGTFNVSRAAAEHFRKVEAGAFVHMTSTAGLIGNVGQANYMAAKMGIVGLSRAIATDMARFKVRSNCIAPFADTRMTRSVVVPPEMKAAREAKLLAMPAAAVASLAGALISDDCKDINGQIFGIRGGEAFVFNQPRPIRSVHHQGGWTPEGLAKVLPKFQAVFAPTSEMIMTWDAIE